VTDEWVGRNLEQTCRGLVEILTWNFLGNPAGEGGKKKSSVRINGVPLRFATGTP
jgi:hypothetical protein